MDLATTTADATIPDWITAISTAVLALSVVAAGLRWTRQQAKELGDPGEPPDEWRGELQQTIEDVLRDRAGTRSDRRQFRREMRDGQQGQPRRVRWQRYLRRRNRRGAARKREARKRNKPVRQAQVQVDPSAPPTQSESSTSGD